MDKTEDSNIIGADYFIIHSYWKPSLAKSQAETRFCQATWTWPLSIKSKWLEVFLEDGI